MNKLISIEDIFRDNVGEYTDGEFLIRLFTTAEELEIASEVELENKLSTRLLGYAMREVRFSDQVYTAIRNVMYVMELYLTSHEFKNTDFTWYDIIKIVNENKRGISNLVHKSEEYLKKRVSRTRIKLESAKRRTSKILGATGYMNMIGNIDVANTVYMSYISSRDFLYDCPIITTTTLMPMFITKNTGHKTIENMVNHILKELDILELFESDDINKLILNYLEQTNQRNFNGNLFELVITNYLFSNVTNENPKSLVVDKVDAEIVFKEIMRERLTAKEILTDGINNLNVPKCKADYINRMERIISKKIESIRKNRTLTDEFIVTIKRE